MRSYGRADQRHDPVSIPVATALDAVATALTGPTVRPTLGPAAPGAASVSAGERARLP